MREIELNKTDIYAHPQSLGLTNESTRADDRKFAVIMLPITFAMIAMPSTITR
jgi:hypothetical protein